MLNKISLLLFLMCISFLVLIPVTHGESEDEGCLALTGGELTAEEARTLEAKVGADPHDLRSRTQLLGYYFLRAFESYDSRMSRQKHIMWIIRNAPDSEIAGLPYASLDPTLDEKVYSQARDLWIKHAETHEENATILGNAARFFFIFNSELAEKYLKQAQTLEPDNPEWTKLLGHLYAMGLTRKAEMSRKETAMNSLDQFENALNKTSQEIERFYMLSDLAKAAFEADNLEKAKLYANELLDSAIKYPDDWNYGNAIHHGNIILGRIALKQDKIEKAGEYLIEAGKTPGSPQLNSFGPNMQLAKDLLDKGEQTVVLEYLDLCKIFWKNKASILAAWKNEIKKGRIPDFESNLAY
jgi:hypothetical protein